MTVSVTVGVEAASLQGERLLVPTGIATPHQTLVAFHVDGGAFHLAGEAETGQMAAVVTPSGLEPIRIRYRYREGGPGYPEALFVPRRNRFTRAAAELADDALAIAGAAPDGHAAIQALVTAAAEKFRYGHPEVRFNDGCDEIPYLACGLTEGSCVDINTYLIASLRAAGLDAGYVYGYFFPEEKAGTCDDGHCWVVTRHDGVVLEWDIAHHLKLGTRTICCGLNPKPGQRVAVAHSMGLSFPALGIAETKLLGEPAWVGPDGRLSRAVLDIRLETAGPAGPV